MKNKIEDLRNHLFLQLERLNEDDCNIEKEAARSDALVKIANALIESGRAETEFLKISKQMIESLNGEFFPEEKSSQKFFKRIGSG